MVSKKVTPSKVGAKKTAATATRKGSGVTTQRSSTGKALTKKTSAPAATRVDDRAPDSQPIPSTQAVVTTDDSVTKIAEQILRGSRRWGTGSERDARLAKAGHNVDAVRREVYRLRAQQAQEAKS